MNTTPEQFVEVHSAARRKARELSLVLHSLGIPHKFHRVEGRAHILVPAIHAARAELEIRQYVEEGPLRSHPPPPADKRAGRSAAVIWVLFLSVIYGLSVYTQHFLGGNAAISNATLIQKGELWRTITSLTLHADPLHLLCNLVFGSLLVGLLAAETGLGTGLLLTLLGGALGNLANAFLSGEGHQSLGASTAVFASLGVLVGARFRTDRAGPARARAWVPLVAGLALLGWLGGPSERMGASGIIRTDVAAHVLGLAAGLLLGVSLLRPGSRFRHQALQLTGTAALLTAAWAAWAFSGL